MILLLLFPNGSQLTIHSYLFYIMSILEIVEIRAIFVQRLIVCINAQIHCLNEQIIISLINILSKLCVLTNFISAISTS